jgi:hypothetical protein
VLELTQAAKLEKLKSVGGGCWALVLVRFEMLFWRDFHQSSSTKRTEQPKVRLRQPAHRLARQCFLNGSPSLAFSSKTEVRGLV